MRNWLLITQDFPPAFVGGIASWASDLAHALVAHNEPVTVLARRTGNTAREDSAQPFTVKRMRGRSWNRWQGPLSAAHAWPLLSPNTRVICATWPLATHLAPRLRGARLGVAMHGSDISRLPRAPQTLETIFNTARTLLPVSNFLGR